MKQNSYLAKTSAALTAALITSLILSSSSCIKPPQGTLQGTQARPEIPKSESGLRININSASAIELERLPGVGVGIAERIVAHRVHYGPFRRPEHLMMVRGISDRKFREISQMIVVE